MSEEREKEHIMKLGINQKQKWINKQREGGGGGK